MLHDGALAREGLIDLVAVDGILAERMPIRGEAYARILSFCDFEAWIQAWA
jgi:asparagine synthase (glutamine-hydrolysing)